MSQKLYYSQMDPEWMYFETMSASFVEGIRSFLNAAMVYVANNIRSKAYIHCWWMGCVAPNKALHYVE